MTQVLLIFIMSYGIKAHPTSFEGGWIIESRMSSPMSEVGVGHTFKDSFALWLKSISFPQNLTNQVSMIQINHLLKRWNERESQGNIYVGLGGGILNKNDFFNFQNSLIASLIQADWETRYIYFMMEAQNFSNSLPHTNMIKLRGGFAPYLAEYDETSTWMIFESLYFDWRFVEFRTLFRIYYKNILYEIGGSLNGTAVINLMTHL